MSHETSKACRRRFLEDQALEYTFWEHIFIGKGIDVGCGDDPLPFKDCVHFDKKDGDAQTLSKYFQPDSFDYIHSSQMLEHLPDPIGALKDWHGLLKRGGHIVFTVPSWELYEGLIWPSRYNPDHRSTWSLYLKGSPAPIHIFIPFLIKELESLCGCLRVELIDSNYNYKKGASRDQTQGDAEAFIELVFRKS